MKIISAYLENGKYSRIVAYSFTSEKRFLKATFSPFQFASDRCVTNIKLLTDFPRRNGCVFLGLQLLDPLNQIVLNERLMDSSLN